MSKITFDALTRMDKRDLELLLKEGDTPQLEELIGFDFRGFNMNPSTVHFKTRKFFKGFFGEPGRSEAWGYNIKARQNARDEPWEPIKGEDGDLKRWYFFKVYGAGVRDDSKYPHCVDVDYWDWGDYFFLNPAAYTRDYLAFPDPGNHDLIVGKAYGPLGLGLGFFILERFAESGYTHTWHYFSDRKLEILEAFAEAVLYGTVDGPTPRDIAWMIDAQLEKIDSPAKKSIGTALTFLRWIHRFHKKSVKKRMKILCKKLVKEGGHARDIARLYVLIYGAYYRDEQVRKRLGYVPPNDRKPPCNPDDQWPCPAKPSKPPKIVITPFEGKEMKTDLCIIGSGAGGAVVAAYAAAAGRKVLLVEAGKFFESSDFSHDEIDMVTRLYKAGGLQTTTDSDMYVLQGECLGGSTVVNNAICFRVTDSPGFFKRWRDELGADINVERLNESYKVIEECIGIRYDGGGKPIPIEDCLAGNSAKMLRQGWKELVQRNEVEDLKTKGNHVKNYKDCVGCGFCNYGCPYGRKLDMLETFIPYAQKINKDTKIVTECRARRFHWRGNHDSRVVNRLESTLADGSEVRIIANEYVVSCGPIASSRLLRRSGKTRNVGRRLSFNAGTPVVAWFPDEEKPLDAFNGVQCGAYIDCGDYMLESVFNPPATMAMLVPGVFKKHAERIRRYRELAAAGVLIATDEDDGHVGGFLNDAIHFEMNETNLATLRDGMRMLSNIYLAAGAEEVYPAMVEWPTIKCPEDIDKYINKKRIKKPEDLTLSSAHPQGGNIMSKDPNRGVVGNDFRVHGFKNLYVCDASVFPTSVRVNPQLTVMAMAHYFVKNHLCA